MKKEIDLGNTLRLNRDLSFYVKSFAGKAAIQDVDLKKRTVTGFYNSFYLIDSVGDMLVAGSAKKSIAENGPQSSGWHIKHALMHDLSRLPGQIVVLEERKMDDIEGIYFETRMANTTLGNDTLINYQEGVYDNHSIGYRYINFEVVKSDSELWSQTLAMAANPEEAEKYGMIWVVKEIELFEGSTVAIGANRLTPFLGVKSDDPELHRIKLFEKLNTLEDQLRRGKQTDDGMRDLLIMASQIKTMIAETWPEQTSTPEKEGPDSTTETGIDFGKLAGTDVIKSLFTH